MRFKAVRAPLGPKWTISTRFRAGHYKVSYSLCESMPRASIRLSLFCFSLKIPISPQNAKDEDANKDEDAGF